ncbi:chemotaxis protein CheX [Cohnella sp. WQ 127256]|uniref:chemotaxis protein CheX n=1 Tax=Cohnella sp. WQ 127256 TaxID=2938790 RepID=UPI002117AA6A|nr:chemotaxis protein CheX [Cohnella sp. WQ 127256]
MASEEGVKDLLNSIIESVNQILSMELEIQSPKVFNLAVIQSEMAVLIGITGDVSGRIVLQGDSETFSKLGTKMFGMPLEGEMLHSCIGEIANMLAGKTSSIVYNKGYKVDITPPTIMVGQMQMYGFERGLSVTVRIEALGDINIILLLQN